MNYPELKRSHDELTRVVEISEVKKMIAGICETLKGPNVGNAERITLHFERKDLRKRLAKLESQSKPS